MLSGVVAGAENGVGWNGPWREILSMTENVGGQPVKFLIVGAGEAGRMAAEEMRRHPDQGLVPVGFIDDDRAKAGRSVAGVPVVGTRADIPRALRETGADELLIALPSASGAIVRQIVQFCETERVRFRIVPGIWEIIRGNVHIQQIRPVHPDDLLGRESVELDLDILKRAYAGKRLLVTGAGGSIGSEICRQLVQALPSDVVLVGRGENSIFEADISLREGGRIGAPRLKTIIADVRDAERMTRILAEERPHAVFHAAAHKHVWLMEQHPDEALLNNLVATADLVEICVRQGVERFVLISSDKAVNPRSVMGATKRLAEIYLMQRARQLAAAGGPATRLMAVRFGNVLGSRGSVVPLFRRQIARGGPVTVSHPDVARYFMTVKEAALLVVEAGGLGQGGEIFILDMGDQMRIAELARDLIVLSGFRPDVDIPITFVGMKPGEKLREELVHPFEPLADMGVTGLRVTRDAVGTGASLVDGAVRELAALARTGDRARILAEIERLVPEAQLARTPVA